MTSHRCADGTWQPLKKKECARCGSGQPFRAGQFVRVKK